MNRNPLVIVVLMVWSVVVFVGWAVKALVCEALTFCLRTVPRLRREVKLTQEMDFRLAERLRRDGR